MGFRTVNGGKGGGNGFGGGGDEFDQLIRMLRENIKLIVAGVAGAILLWGVATSFYTVQPSEEAVVTRFGAYLETTQPGLHFKLPYGIDQVDKLKTRVVLQEEFGYRKGGDRTSRRKLDQESLMLTGDLNVADVEWVVQYRIADPRKFLFNARDPVRSIRDVSQAVMRRVVGNHLVSDVITSGRVGISSEAQELTQSVLDHYDLGILVVTVKLQDVNPPESVQASFNEVNAAKQEQEQAVNNAEKYYNKIIPEARGKAKERVSRAEGYSAALVNRAKGDAEKFETVLQEYRKAPKVTRKRMYLETMEELFARFERLTIVDSKVKGVLPVFKAGQLQAPAKEGQK